MNSLIKVKFRQLKNRLQHSGKKKYLLFIFLGAIITFLIGFFFIKIFGFLYNQPEFPFYFKLFLSEKILMMVFLTLFLMLILSTLISALNIFFLSKDLCLLFASPIKVKTIFIWKSMETAITSASMVIFFALPVLFSYSFYFAPKWESILGIILAFLLFIFSGVLIGILISMIIPAFFSAKKLQPVLSLITIVLISFIVIFLRFLRPEQFLSPDTIENLFKYMGEMNVSSFSYFPFYWLSKAITNISNGDCVSFWKTILLFLIIITMLSSVILVFQKKFYLKLFDKLNEGSMRITRSRWTTKNAISELGLLWKKETKTFIRTPSQWSQLLIIGAMVIVFILNMRSIPLPHPSIKNIIAYLNFGMVAFIIIGLNSRFTFTAIPLEGPGIVHILASPLKRKKFFLFKLLFFTIPQIFIGIILLLATDFSLQLDSFFRLTGIVFLMPSILLLSLLAFFYGLQVKELIPLSPQHLIVSKAGISYMLWGLAFVVFSMFFFHTPIISLLFQSIKKRTCSLLRNNAMVYWIRSH